VETPVLDRSLALQQRNRKVRLVLLAILGANWVVAAAKLGFGLLSQSASVTADGLHSFIDGGSNVLGLVAMGVASRPADEDHPYGHGKFEALASLGIGAMIGIGMLELGRMALDSVMHDKHPQVTATMAGVMAFTLVVNMVVTRVERHYGHKYKSSLLLADASHTMSDVYVTLAVLGSLLLVWLGFPRADGLIALGVMVFVAWVAYGIVRQAVSASISAPVRAVATTRLRISIPSGIGCSSTSTWSSGSGWASGISSDVRFAPWMPARRATAKASPFGRLASRMRVWAESRTRQEASATRRVTGFSETSTMWALPCGSRWLKEPCELMNGRFSSSRSPLC
jgi:cation diffusion facilitator family transporter